MNLPDYGAEVQRIGDWIVAGVTPKPTPNKTIFLENDLPPKEPDTCVLCFETGGNWDKRTGRQDWTILIVVRAPELAKARALAVNVLKSAVNGWIGAAQKGEILNLDVGSLPKLQPRDDRNRVILEATLTMTLYAPMDAGVPR